MATTISAMTSWRNTILSTPFFHNEQQTPSYWDISDETSSHWDISNETRQLIELITGMYLAVLVSVLGILGNSLNLVVFCKQGLGSSINISFMLLALSDNCSLTTLLWYNICGSPVLLEADTLFYFTEVKNLTAEFPHGCFTYISGWIIVWIMVERCLCVAFPLSIKRLVTPGRTTVIIVSIYLVIILSLVPVYCNRYLDWKFVPQQNKTLIRLIISDNGELESMAGYLYSSYIISSFLAVPILSCILLVLYHSKNEWRLANVKDRKTTEAMTNRERSLVKIVLVEGIIFTITYSVSALVVLACILDPQFSFIGQLSNLFSVSVSFSLLLDSINSSIHIVLYLKMSSNFRNTLLELFQCLKSSRK